MTQCTRVIPTLVQPLLGDKSYVKFRGSHDQNKDALRVYREVFGLPFHGVNPGESGGLDWLDHYMMIDRTTPHPFFQDELLEDGQYRLGCPGCFLVVEDHKYEYPKDVQPDTLDDSDLCRYQFNNWRMRPSVLNDAGFFEYGPMKMNDDFGQGAQMLFHDNCVRAAPLTKEEQVFAHLPERLHPAEIAKVDDPLERARRMSAQLMQRRAIEQEASARPRKHARNAIAALRGLGKNRR